MARWGLETPGDWFLAACGAITAAIFFKGTLVMLFENAARAAVGGG